MRNWNKLSHHEAAWVERNAEADKALKILQESLRSLVGSHTCRYRDEGEHLDDLHPTCLLCGETNDMEAYCADSPYKVCCFRYGGGPADVGVRTYEDVFNEWAHEEDIPSVIRDGACVHCSEPFRRSR